MSELPTVYLGDGAYAEFTGYSIVIFTSNGIEHQNEVHLEHNELYALIEFIKDKGIIHV